MYIYIYIYIFARTEAYDEYWFVRHTLRTATAQRRLRIFFVFLTACQATIAKEVVYNRPQSVQYGRAKQLLFLLYFHAVELYIMYCQTANQ